MCGTLTSTLLSHCQLLYASQHWILAQGNRSWPPLTSFTFCISSHGAHACTPIYLILKSNFFNGTQMIVLIKIRGNFINQDYSVPALEVALLELSEWEVAVLTLFGNYSPVIARSLSSLYSLSISEEPRENFLQNADGFCFIGFI